MPRPSSPSPSLLAGLLVACALLGGCGSDEPTRDRATVDRTHDVIAGAPDAHAATDTHPDAVGPTDTASPTDTAGPTDTQAPLDTVGPTDTASPPDTTAPAGELTGPDVLSLPWVAAGAGGSTANAVFVNAGASGALDVALSGDPALSLTGAPPASLAAGASLSVTVAFNGSATARVARGDLRVSVGTRERTLPVWAVAGDPAIPAATWAPLAVRGVTVGHGVTLPLPTAPYPVPGGSWSDPSVLLFVPAGLRDRGATDLVVHFHGFGAVVDGTIATQRYREQLHISGINAVLVAPQGPYNASSGNFGKLMLDGGLAALADDVVSVLYRDGWIAHPVPGDLLLTAHSGGYQGVAQNLDATTPGGQTTHAVLIDGLYARSSDYAAFANAGGSLRSNYTASGGTRTNNEALAQTLGAATAPTQQHLRDAGALIWFVATGHNDAMRYETSWAEALRWAATRSRQGPRLELRSARASGGVVTVRWFSPEDDDVLGFAVEASEDGASWEVVASTSAQASSATFAHAGGVHVRVAPRVYGVAAADALRSDSGYVGGANAVVVVDGFDRLLGSSFYGLRHDFAAWIGASADAAAYASNEAVTEGSFPLAAYDAAIWLLGDESTGDHTFTAAEQAAVTAYLDGGGALVVSGSEVGWDLGAQGHGVAFLGGLGAKYAADDSGSYTVSGAGPLAGVGALSYAGPGAAYDEEFPDAFTAATGGEVVLRYANGQGAAAGVPAQSVVVGFPLELVDDPGDLAVLLAALLDYVLGG